MFWLLTAVQLAQAQTPSPVPYDQQTWGVAGEVCTNDNTIDYGGYIAELYPDLTTPCLNLGFELLNWQIGGSNAALFPSEEVICSCIHPHYLTEDQANQLLCIVLPAEGDQPDQYAVDFLTACWAVVGPAPEPVTECSNGDVSGFVAQQYGFTPTALTLYTACATWSQQFLDWKDPTKTQAQPTGDVVCPCFETAVTTYIDSCALVVEGFDATMTAAMLRDGCLGVVTTASPTAEPTDAPEIPLCELADFSGPFGALEGEAQVNCAAFVVSYNSALTDPGYTIPDEVICACLLLLDPTLVNSFTCAVDAQQTTLSQLQAVCIANTPLPTLAPTPDPTDFVPSECTQTDLYNYLVTVTNMDSSFTSRCALTLDALNGIAAGTTSSLPSNDILCACLDPTYTTPEMVAPLQCYLDDAGTTLTQAYAGCIVFLSTGAPSRAPTEMPTPTPTEPLPDRCKDATSVLLQWASPLGTGYDSACINLVNAFDAHDTDDVANPYPDKDTICACFDITVVTVEKAGQLECMLSHDPPTTGTDMRLICANTDAPSTTPTMAPVNPPTQGPLEACEATEVVNWISGVTLIHPELSIACQTLGQGFADFYDQPLTASYPDDNTVCGCFDTTVMSRDTALLLDCWVQDFPRIVSGLTMWEDCIPPTPEPTQQPTPNPIPSDCTSYEAVTFIGRFKSADGVHYGYCATLAVSLNEPFDEEVVCRCINPELDSVTPEAMDGLKCKIYGYTGAELYNLCSAYTFRPTSAPSRSPTLAPTIPDLCEATVLNNWFLTWSVPVGLACNTLVAQFTSYNEAEALTPGSGTLPTEETICACADTQYLTEELANDLDCGLTADGVMAIHLYQQCWKSVSPTISPTPEPTSDPTPSPVANLCDITDIGNFLTANPALAANQNILNACNAMATKLTTNTAELNDYCACFDVSIVTLEQVQTLDCKFEAQGDTPEEIYGQCLSLTPFPTKVPSRAPTDAPTKNPTDNPTAEPTQDPTSNPTVAPTVDYCSATDFAAASSLVGAEVLLACMTGVQEMTDADSVDPTSAEFAQGNFCACMIHSPYTFIASVECKILIYLPVDDQGTIVPIDLDLVQLHDACTSASRQVSSANDYGRNWWDGPGDQCHNPKCGYGVLDAALNCQCITSQKVKKMDVGACSNPQMPMRNSEVTTLVVDACWPMSMSPMPVLDMGDDSIYGFEYVKITETPTPTGTEYQWTGYMDEHCLIQAWEGETVSTGTGQCSEAFMGGTDFPTKAPSVSPTLNPTDQPSVSPTPEPTANPTDQPSRSPSRSPTACSWDKMHAALSAAADANANNAPVEVQARWISDCGDLNNYVQNEYYVNGDTSGWANQDMVCGCIYAEHVYGVGYDDGGAFRDEHFSCTQDQYIDGPNLWSVCTNYWAGCTEAELISAAAAYVFGAGDATWNQACETLALAASSDQATQTGILPLTDDETCACLDTRRLPESFGDDALNCWLTATVHGSYYWNLCTNYYRGCETTEILEFFLGRVLDYEAWSLEQTGEADLDWGTACLRVIGKFRIVIEAYGTDETTFTLPTDEETCPCLNPDMIPRQELVDELTCRLTTDVMVVNLYDQCFLHTGWLEVNQTGCGTTDGCSGVVVNPLATDSFSGRRMDLDMKAVDVEPLVHNIRDVEPEDAMSGEWLDEFHSMMEGPVGTDYYRRISNVFVEPHLPPWQTKVAPGIRRRPSIGAGTDWMSLCGLCRLAGGFFNMDSTSCYYTCFETVDECIANDVAGGGVGCGKDCAATGNGGITSCDVIAPAVSLFEYEMESVETVNYYWADPLAGGAEFPDTIENDPTCVACTATNGADACTSVCVCDFATHCTDPEMRPYCEWTCLPGGDFDPAADYDGDGMPNYMDQCPKDALKVAPGDCGCGSVDEDLNSNFISDCIESGLACNPIKEWSEALAALQCPGQTDKAYGAKMCSEYDSPMWQRRLDLALANFMFTDCTSDCVYDIESSMSDEIAMWGFRWVGGDNCWTAMTGFYCFNQRAADAAAAEIKAQAFCAINEAPCQTILQPEDWTATLASSRCPAVADSEPQYTAEAQVCSDWERDPWGYYASAADLYTDRFKIAVANHVYRSCESRCVYDVETAADVAWQWHSYFKCWKKQTWWNCFTVYTSELNEAIRTITGATDTIATVYPPLCEVDATPAPTAVTCVARVEVEDWTQEMAEAVCPPGRVGDTQKDLDNARLCDGHADYDIYTWRLRASLANRMFKSCDAWCVYDLPSKAGGAFSWDNNNKCYNYLTWWTCINQLWWDKEYMRDWANEAICESSTPEPTYQPTCRPERDATDDRINGRCDLDETGSTIKHVNYEEGGVTYDAHVCYQLPCMRDFPTLLSNTTTCADLKTTIDDNCAAGCGTVAAGDEYTAKLNLIVDGTGGALITDANAALYSFTDICGETLGTCQDCHDTCASDVSCETEEEKFACPFTCGECSTTLQPDLDDYEYVLGSAEYEADMEDFRKSLANEFFEDCTAWCVFSWNKIHETRWAWKWSSKGCYYANTWSDCFWNFGTNSAQTAWRDFQEARTVTCTRAPTAAPTGCYPMDYEWNAQRAEETCAYQDNGVTDKTITAKSCHSDDETYSKDGLTRNLNEMFNTSLALEMYTKCNSWCLYDYITVAKGLNGSPSTGNVYAPNGQFIWRQSPHSCWEFHSDGFFVCNGAGAPNSPSDEWFEVAAHVENLCLYSDTAWDE